VVLPLPKNPVITVTGIFAAIIFSKKLNQCIRSPVLKYGLRAKTRFNGLSFSRFQPTFAFSQELEFLAFFAVRQEISNP